MKSMFPIALFTAAASMGVAAEPIALSTPAPHASGFEQKANYNDWRSYLRLGVSNSRPNDLARVMPDVGLGLRFALPVGALDLSASYTGDNPFAKQDDKTYFFTTPRASYLLYLSSAKNQSLYGGVGLAFGGMKTKDQARFRGLIPSVSVGLEMNRLQRLSNFLQLDVSQPALAISWKNPAVKTVSWDLGPIVQFSGGCGF